MLFFFSQHMKLALNILEYFKKVKGVFILALILTQHGLSEPVELCLQFSAWYAGLL